MIKHKNDYIYIYIKDRIDRPIEFGLKMRWGGDLFTNCDDAFCFDGVAFGTSCVEKLFNNITSMESSCCGEYSCVHVCDDFITANTDPLGANQIYYIDCDKFFCLSNSFELIFNWGSKYIEYTYNFDAFLNSMFFGFSFYPTTSINEIKLLNLDEYIKIDRKMKRVSINKRNYFLFMEDVVNKKIDYNDLVAHSASLIKKHAAEVINESYGKQKIVLELTGGKDSRIVLAALLSNGFTDFLLRTFGANSSFDMRFSSLIAFLYNLKYITYEYDMSHISASKKNYLKSAGVTRLADIGYRSLSQKADFTILTGTYGEASRSYYAKLLFYKLDKNIFNYRIMDEFTQFYKMFDIFAYRNFVTKEHKRIHSEKCKVFYNDFKYKNNLLMLLDYPLYFSRFRYHFGDMLKNRNRFFYESYSLTNIFLYHALAYSVSFNERVNDKNPHSIINELYPPLCFFPHENEPYYVDMTMKHSNILNLIKIPDKALRISYQENYKYTNKYDELELIKECENIYKNLILDNRMSQFINLTQANRLLLSKNKEKILINFSALLYFYEFIFKKNNTEEL